jgi:hypothetical protein
VGNLEAEKMTSVEASDASVDEEIAAFMNEDDTEFLTLLEGLNSWEASLYLAVLRIRIRIHPQDPHVFGPPGSGSISQRFGSGSGSFSPKARIVRKTLIFTVLLLPFDFLSLKNDVTVSSKSNMRKNKK